MPLSVFGIVLFAALLHASWNAIVKSAPDKLLTTILVAASAAAIGTLIVPVTGVVASAISLGEPLGVPQIGALALTIAGVVIAARA